SPTTYPVSFTGKGDASADGSVLTKVSTTSFTLTDADSTVTTWTKTGTVWLVSSIAEPGSLTTSYTYDGSNRVTQIVAPAPSGVSCTSAPTSTAGCRTLTLAYASSSTSTPPGDFAGRLKSITYTAADPQNTNTMTTIEVAHYAYDSAGRLVQAWDPRLDHSGSHVMTQYGYYSGTNRLQTYTPPGLAAWTITYDGSNRVATVWRPDAALGQTATWTMAYGINPAGGGGSTGLPDLSATAMATWGQNSDLPVTGTAVFPPDHVPSGTPTASDWPYAPISYLDADGRDVNDAGYGAGAWQIDTTTYAANGSLVRTLGARERAEALDTSNAASWASGYANAVRNTASSVTRAAMLDSEDTYDSTGVELTDTLGPIHQVRLDNATIVDARTHVHTDYDQGSPGGATYYLPTNTATSARTLDGTDHDTRSTVTGYGAIVSGDPTGWSLREPTRSTVHMGGSNDIITTTRYNPQGQVVETRLPGNSSGGGAGTTIATYWTATGTGTCNGNPALAGMVCQTAPAAQPSGAPLPVRAQTYDLYGDPVTITETYPGTSTIRTVTLSYDSVGRVTGDNLSVSPTASGGTPLPPATITYDPTTGFVTSVSTSGGSIGQTYDTLGRVHTYTDATGNVTTTGYDIDGRVATVADGKGTATYTYDSSNEHRSLVTALDTGMGANPSVFSATYDAGGDLASQTYPSGLVATTTANDVGEPVALRYAKTSTWLEFTRTFTSQDQAATDTSPQSAQSYGYDPDARLTSVADTVSGFCTTRVYAFDPTLTGGLDSNRTSLTSYPAVSGGACSTATTPTTITNTFDTADRITNTGYSYDDLGRTLTIPAGDAASASTLTYYANDTVNTMTSGSAVRTVSLDPGLRVLTIQDSGGSNPGTVTDHYSGSGDSPVWVTEKDGTWTRNVIGVDGSLAALQTSSQATLKLTDLHSDIVATVPDQTSATGIASYSESTEFGLTRAGDTAPARYGWLGGAQRDASSATGLVLMGSRVYNPFTGRFLQSDSIEGGNANAYTYPTDPVDGADLSGDSMCAAPCGAGGAPVALPVINFPPTVASLAAAVAALIGVSAKLLEGMSEEALKKTPKPTKREDCSEALKRSKTSNCYEGWTGVYYIWIVRYAGAPTDVWKYGITTNRSWERPKSQLNKCRKKADLAGGGDCGYEPLASYSTRWQARVQEYLLILEYFTENDQFPEGQPSGM
ncbi:MAG TPA: RHS repeat-associated core domain-containing protein, partial [Actinomycetes bacterium]|nr:RHS repeat-associated core domain-containing protein [Actinomycetes bacterium]